jgi:hypothetical protein
MSMGGEFFSPLFPFRFASVIPPVVVEVVHYVWVVALSSVGPFASSVFVCTLLALDFLGSFWFFTCRGTRKWDGELREQNAIGKDVVVSTRIATYRRKQGPKNVLAYGTLGNKCTMGIKRLGNVRSPISMCKV